MKIIKSTNNYNILVDNNKFDYLNQFKWYVLITKDGNKYARTTTNKIYMHRLLLKPNKNIYVDHIDGDGLNNTISNLRLSNNQLNQANSRKHQVGYSIYKGVSWSKERQCWRAYISPNKKFKHLGYFSSEKRAAKVYNYMALKIFGKSAYLNEV